MTHSSLFMFTLALKFCASLLEAVDFRVSAWHIRGVSLFNVYSSSTFCLSVKFASAPTAVCRYTSLFGAISVSLNIIFFGTFSIIKILN